MMTLYKSTKGVSLQYLVDGLTDKVFDDDLYISGLSMDSRKIRAGYLFIACKGLFDSGLKYIQDAIDAGACAILVDNETNHKDKIQNTPLIDIDNLRGKVGIISSRFYGYPSNDLNIVGITGTNGKTSVSYFIAQVLSEYRGNICGLIGTLGYGPYNKLEAGQNTTPDSVTLQHNLVKIRDAGATDLAMEVSSCGLEQGRIAEVGFNIAVFTNLSSDHLDCHGDMQAYADAKRKLFSVDGLQHAVININDDFGKILATEIKDRLHVIEYKLVDSFSDTKKANQILATVLEHEIDFLSLEIKSPWGNGYLQVAIGGKYNAENLLACLAVLCLLDLPFDKVLKGLSRISGVPGRMESLGGNGNTSIFVDYAHTPDALEKALSTLHQYCIGELICVFGCGGGRDKSKRAVMGGIAEQHSDKIILTNDNPRTEDPQSIIDDILVGIDKTKSVFVEQNREQAIIKAIELAGNNDVVLIAGKGHETYQEISGICYPFSDRQFVRNYLKADR